MNPAPLHNCYATIMQTFHDAAPEIGMIEDVVVKGNVLTALQIMENAVRKDCLEVILPAGTKIK